MPSPKDVEVNAIDILNCWDETLRTNNRNALGQHLAPDFAFQMLGQNAMEQTSDEHLDWCTSDESPQIDNIDVRYDSEGYALEFTQLPWSTVVCLTSCFLADTTTLELSTGQFYYRLGHD
jgi:hypothetical protein